MFFYISQLELFQSGIQKKKFKQGWQLQLGIWIEIFDNETQTFRNLPVLLEVS